MQPRPAGGGFRSIGFLLVALVVLGPGSARAEPIAIDRGGTITDVDDAASAAAFLGGAALGFVAHEGGHVFANLAQGNTPDVEGLTAFGFIPFFAITPHITCVRSTCYDRDGKVFSGGPRGKFVITSAGYNVQHLGSEIVLSHEPGLRYRRAPFRKGLLAFNVLLSIGYALSSITRTEDLHGDLFNSARTSGIQRDLFAVFVMAPAILDAYRYFFPESHWAPWVSRGTKAAFVGIVFSF